MTRVCRIGLMACTLLTICCLVAPAQDLVPVSTQLDRSEVGLRARVTRAPAPSCPELEQLGYEFRRLYDVQLDIRLLDTETPADCSVNLFQLPDSDSSAIVRPHFEFTWVPTELWYKPLYFEDAILERAGQSKHALLQPWLSGAHFFGTFPLMPYRIGLDRPYDRVYSLGHYRPGSPTPCLGNRLPLEVDAATFEAMTWAGLFFLLP